MWADFTLMGVMMSLILNRSANAEKVVNSPQELQNIDSSKLYVIGGVIDFTGTGLNIVVPAGGFNYRGLGNAVTGFVCDDDNYTLFTSPAGGSGSIQGRSCFVRVTGNNSRLYALTDATRFNAIEVKEYNHENCTSLGYLDSYRQYLEIDTGRFGGKPELELRGVWLGGLRISTSIVANLDDLDSALFKAGAGFKFNGRFKTDMVADLPTNGALLNFLPANVANDESLIIEGATITRNGVANASDSTLYPNINHESVKSRWSNNTGLPNTKKYIKGVCTAEVETVIGIVGEYYPLLGTMTIDKAAQLSMPVNGQYELLTGEGVYNILGTIQIQGNNGDLIHLRASKSSDGFVTSTVVNHIEEEIPNLAGTPDFVTFSVNFIERLKKGDRLRLEVENMSAARNVTMGSQSFIVISEV